MKRITKLASRLTLAFLTFMSASNPALGEDLLFGKPYTPYSGARNTQAWTDFRKRKIERERQLFGTKNGMLAEDLQSRMVVLYKDPLAGGLDDTLREWAEVYPKIPSGSQLFLARHALFIANNIRREAVRPRSVHRCGNAYDPKRDGPMSATDKEKTLAMADTITGCVLNAGMANNWYLSADLKEQLQLISALDVAPQFKQQAREILAKKPRQADLDFDQLFGETSTLATNAMAKAKEVEKK